MRYEDEKDINTNKQTVREEKSGSGEDRKIVITENMEQAGDGQMDQLQATVFNTGGRVLNMLSSDVRLNGKASDEVKRAREALEQLGAFRYNIGFAGPQSCGKSSLINAIIQYPLMPTCNLATTCTPVEVMYGKVIRMIIKDEDKDGKVVFDQKCGSISKGDFDRLKNYACNVMSIAIIENLQLFSDVYIAEDTNNLSRHIHMDQNDPRQVALLLMILFTVYVHQNNKELNAKEKALNALRKETLTHFGIKKNTVNYRVVVQWDNPMLASGLMITDLPGLGSSAEDKTEDGKVIKGHDTITKEAVLRTDTMAFMSEPLVLADAVPVLETMVSNAHLLDVVSVDDRIVPIMNKVDLLKGEQKKLTTINMMLGMMQNAGVDMTGRKVWETSSYYGEYAYEGMDLSKSFLVQNEIYDLVKNGYSEEEIQEELPGILRKMKHGYERSGVDQLREFFRTAFIGKGKCQKAFSSVAALRALAIALIKPLCAAINMDTTMAAGNEALVKEALEYLQEAATTRLDNAQSEIKEKVNKLTDEDNQEIIHSLLRDAQAQYMTSFEDAVDSYSSSLLAITGKFNLTWIGFGNRARVDSGDSYNHGLYETLLDKSRSLYVDLKEVNKVYATTLRHCGNDTEGIYQHMLNGLVTFQKDYPNILKDCLDSYRDKVDPSVIALMGNMVPALLDFVDAKIKTADASMAQLKESIQAAGDQIARDIIELNDEYVNVLLEMVHGKLDTESGGWFVRKEFLVIDGDRGLNATIRSLKLTNADKEHIKAQIEEMGRDKINNSLVAWYKEAETNAKSILSKLVVEILELFRQVTRDLEKNTKEKEAELEANVKLLDDLYDIFEKMQNDIQPEIDRALNLGISTEYTAMEGDLFEGMLRREAS